MSQINFTTHGDALKKAHQAVLSGDPDTDWALFTYDKASTDLKVQDTGDGGLEELYEEFSDGRIQYAFVRVLDPNSKLNKLILIAWCGSGVPISRKGYFASHLDAVSHFLSGYHLKIHARSETDVEPSYIMKRLNESGGSKYSFHDEKPQRSERPAPVGSVYQPTKVDMAQLKGSVSGTTSSTSSVIKERDAAEERRKQEAAATAAREAQVRERQELEEARRRAAEAKRKEEAEAEVKRERQMQEEKKRREEEEEEKEAKRQKEQALRQEEQRSKEAEERIKEREAAEARQRQEEQRVEEKRKEHQRKAEEEEQRKEEEEERKIQDLRAAQQAKFSLSSAMSELSFQTGTTAKVDVESIHQSPQPKDSSPKKAIFAIAMYDYDAEETGEINFKEGQILEVIERNDPGWWKGSLGGGEPIGMFPSNYVQLVDDPEETLDQGGEKAVALFDFDGSAEDELTFREGDILIDIDQMNGSDWWTGTKESGGQRGLFPANYVEIQ
ncbi:MAG: hypothetical protein DHS80DRAFT_29782 [Piptocephalis tieghemiana]|nr:MAG: hypothetical protein DHS80DRAFT_29782 [Piptocephalis tieghemiana]